MPYKISQLEYEKEAQFLLEMRNKYDEMWRKINVSLDFRLRMIQDFFNKHIRELEITYYNDSVESDEFLPNEFRIMFYQAFPEHALNMQKSLENMIKNYSTNINELIDNDYNELTYAFSTSYLTPEKITNFLQSKKADYDSKHRNLSLDQRLCEIHKLYAEYLEFLSIYFPKEEYKSINDDLMLEFYLFFPEQGLNHVNTRQNILKQAGFTFKKVYPFVKNWWNGEICNIERDIRDIGIKP